MVTREDAINTAKNFINDCHANGLDFYKVLLFGSVATDKIRQDSDIDLLLISDRFGDNIFENLRLYSKINLNICSEQMNSVGTGFGSWSLTIETTQREVTWLHGPLNTSTVRYKVTLVSRVQYSLLIAHWLLVPGDRGSNSGKCENFNFSYWSCNFLIALIINSWSTTTHR